LDNLAKFFALLLYTNSISWKIFSVVNLAVIGSSLSGRAYFKALFKELINLMGREALKDRILDP